MIFRVIFEENNQLKLILAGPCKIIRSKASRGGEKWVIGVRETLSKVAIKISVYHHDHTSQHFAN